MVIKLNIQKKKHKRTLITSALPYVHNAPHLGNIIGSMLPAEVFYRYLKLKGENVLCFCGSDEHGTPTEVEAIKKGIPPEKLSEKNHNKFAKILEKFNIQFTLYGRTHTESNKEETYKIIRELHKNGFIVERIEKQPYCLNDKRFLADRYVEGICPNCGGLGRGDQCDDCGKLLNARELKNARCKICGKNEIEFRETKHLYLQLFKFEKQLKEWLEKNRPIPEHKLKEVLNLIDEGLVERPITRDIKWGFPVPWKDLGLREQDYRDKVIYVWFDAPIGYIGITKDYFKSIGKEEGWINWWKSNETRTIYSIGKDNTIFHSIIFPSMLIGSGDNYVLPSYEFIHEFLLSEDVKFSKSRNEGLTTEQALEMLPADYWRFYLVSVLPDKQDTVFSWKDFEAKINGELNDNLGNFVNRVLTLAEKWFKNEVPKANLKKKDNKVLEEAKKLMDEYQEAFDNYKIRRAFETSLELARLGNKYIGEEEPWKSEKNRKEVIFVCLNIVKFLGILFWPIIPESSEKIFKMLNLGEVKFDFSLLKGCEKLGEKEILFKKIDSKDLQEKVN